VLLNIPISKSAPNIKFVLPPDLARDEQFFVGSEKIEQ
jgi:hypothetical protein